VALCLVASCLGEWFVKAESTLRQVYCILNGVITLVEELEIFQNNGNKNVG